MTEIGGSLLYYENRLTTVKTDGVKDNQQQGEV